MGCFDKCCPCLSREKSVKVCTYLMIIFFALSVISEFIPDSESDGGFDYFNLISIGLSVGLIISLIFLLIGIDKRKRSYLKQFDNIFAILVILCSIGFMYIIVIGIIAIIALLISDKDNSNNNNNIAVDGDDVTESSSLMLYTIIINIVYVVVYGLFIFYYITTHNFINDLMKEIKSEENARNVENGNKA